MPKIGSRVYGAAAVLLGAIAIYWGAFANIWQPFPDELPSHDLFALAAGLIFLAAGAALLVRRFEGPAALAVAALSLVFVIGWVRRIFLLPHIPGIWFGPAEQLSVVIGALAIVAVRRPGALRTAHALRLVFGICLLAFGVVHFLSVKETADMVPAWIPPGQRFWALATGVADVAAGLALLAGPFALLAARLATAMFLGFAVLVWLPRVAAAPAEHIVWSGTAMTFAIAAAAWAVADLIARVPPPDLFPRRR